jgi:hypothetical protein
MLNIFISFTSTGAGDIVHVAKCQVETGSSATNYIDGSLGDGYAWTGVVHASTSTRAADADCEDSGTVHMIARNFQLRPRATI